MPRSLPGSARTAEQEEDAMAAHDTWRVADQVTLTGDDGAIYEATATLEFIGHSTTVGHIAAAVNREADSVLAVLASLVDRGMLVKTEGDGEAVYEPTWRGWSTAPEQATGPLL
jgi:hypothetical protein